MNQVFYGNDLVSYQHFRQAYDQFLDTHDLRQEWPRTWKDSLDPHHFEIMCLTSSQLQFQELLYEVILTEKTYVDDLTLAYKIFAKDALAWSQLPKSLRLIFDNLLQIIRLHLGLLQDLRNKQRLQHPIIRSIADQFLGYAPRFLDYYSAYFINFEKANDVVVRSMASKTDPLGIYLRSRSSWPECRNLTLQSFLLKPVQRLMKYPLFFQSLSDSLSNNDVDRINHLRTLHELKSAIRKIEMDKKESEDMRKLEDLAARISGLSGNLVSSGRRLVYEGYLTLVPSLEAPLMRSVTTDALGGQQYTYAPHPNVGQPRSNSFSLGSSKKSIYVFLFNDVILCTKVRSKTRLLVEDVKVGSYYGPNPHSLFKLVQLPGQLTFVDRSVSRVVNGSKDESGLEQQGSRSSLRFSSIRRSRSNYSSVSPMLTFEEHPQQFICSIATRHITNYHFETTTAEEKKQWCDHMESVLESHVQRPDWWHPDGNQSMDNLNTPQNRPASITMSIQSLAVQHTLGLTLEQSDSLTPLSSSIVDSEQQQQQQQQRTTTTTGTTTGTAIYHRHL
ncbi:Dbl homology domain-containing protein [Halteromyces radiatus]|uniref:Dbl homology domain-containing protein n=1 Tax=Halteromyces radiatus TaxID=101107 RepID=UPI00221F208D|nr:Dbl homology domain-containing protein [Halteromyces radiatus]KAI8089246.1 Dbl homology domain-containing protein [Halteromyces radiatus]